MRIRLPINAYNNFWKFPAQLSISVSITCALIWIIGIFKIIFEGYSFSDFPDIHLALVMSLFCIPIFIFSMFMNARRAFKKLEKANALMDSVYNECINKLNECNNDPEVISQNIENLISLAKHGHEKSMELLKLINDNKEDIERNIGQRLSN